SFLASSASMIALFNLWLGAGTQTSGSLSIVLLTSVPLLFLSALALRFLPTQSKEDIDEFKEWSIKRKLWIARSDDMEFRKTLYPLFPYRTSARWDFRGFEGRVESMRSWIGELLIRT